MLREMGGCHRGQVVGGTSGVKQTSLSPAVFLVATLSPPSHRCGTAVSLQSHYAAIDEAYCSRPV